MGSKLELKVFVAFSLLASAAGCGQVADLGNNGSGGADPGGAATGGAPTMSFGGSTGGTAPSNTGGEPGGRGSATGGVTSTGGAGPIPADDACVASVLAAKSCTICHSTANAALIGAGLVLEGSNLGARLSTTRATYSGVANAASCVAGALIIDRESPADGVLLRKVTATQACGDSMPQGSGLDGADLSCIQNWISKF